ncbi:hypothetical protein [Actinophytocola oryzae]|uniref:Uncharacterized protein n=1 Tax=Actinophytocola oryzae TaxID=502181 RepID=A0A4R7VH41_9PSEU|nr:hypothetical protein [Actinophytocola oryzae]TDV48643.1 hypothetical protein CLV71_1083 [Actinophytocola oryzae]
MTEPSAAVALHDTLLRVAGWVPDDLLTDARARLARGAGGEVARILAFAGTRTTLPLTDDDMDLLGDLLTGDGADERLLDAVELAAEEPVLLWRFTAKAPEHAGDEVDGDLLAAVAGEPGVLGLWRAWRWPADNAPYPPPRAVHVVEADPTQLAEGGLPGLTARLQSLLSVAGEQFPQVEVVATVSDPPWYQRMARAVGTLLWSVRPDVEPVVARVFDMSDPELGPRFAPDHPRMTDESERERVLWYLRSGTELLVTLATMPDVADPARGSVVPMTFRTDGRWIWPDAVTYYLEEHRLTPDPDLVAHIRTTDGPPPGLDTVALQRAMAVLTQPLDDERIQPTA